MRYLILSLTFFISITHGTTCPHPVASMLRWGEIPTPWELNPFSAYPPQGEDGTSFVKASILVAGLSRGIVCHYKNSLGIFSIWWQTSVSIPFPSQYDWRRNLAGYECTAGIKECFFQPE